MSTILTDQEAAPPGKAKRTTYQDEVFDAWSTAVVAAPDPGRLERRLLQGGEITARRGSVTRKQALAAIEWGLNRLVRHLRVVGHDTAARNVDFLAAFGGAAFAHYLQPFCAGFDQDDIRSAVYMTAKTAVDQAPYDLAFDGAFAEMKPGHDPIQSPAPAIRTAEEEILATLDEPPQDVFSTGFLSIDALIEGIKAGELFLIAAPTGSGKTFLVLLFAVDLASKGQPVLVVETELRSRAITARLAALRAKGRLGNPNAILRDRTKDLQKKAAAALHGLPIYVRSFADHDDDGDPIEQIEKWIDEVIAATGKAPVVFIDYMQDLNKAEEKFVRQGVSAVSKKLRLLATRRNLALVALSSTARANHMKSDSKISLDPIDYVTTPKESGNGEYDAAAGGFLLTLPKESIESTHRDAAFIVWKTRGGELGVVGLKLDTSVGLFTEDPGALKRIEKRSANTTKAKAGEQLDAIVAVLRKGGNTGKTRTLVRKERGINQNSFTANVDLLIASGRVCDEGGQLYAAECPRGVFSQTDGHTGEPFTTSTAEADRGAA